MLSPRANFYLTFTHLESVSEIQHSGRADHNMVNGQKLQPCLLISKGKHLTDESTFFPFPLVLLCFPDIPRGQGKRKTVFWVSLLASSISFSMDLLCSLHSVASLLAPCQHLHVSKSAFPEKMLLNNCKELWLLALSVHGTANWIIKNRNRMTQSRYLYRGL